MSRYHRIIILPDKNVNQFEGRLNRFLCGYRRNYELVVLDKPDLKNWSLVHDEESILNHYKLFDASHRVVAELLVLQFDNGILELDMQTCYESASEWLREFSMLSIGDDFLDALVAYLEPKHKYLPLERKIFDYTNAKILHLDYLKTNIFLFVEWLATQSVGADFPLKILNQSEFDGSRFRFVTLEGYKNGIHNPMTVYYPGGFTPVGQESPVLTRPVISFQLQQLASERLSIKALCHPSPKFVREQFDLLLDKISQVWPEAQIREETISNVLIVFANPKGTEHLRGSEEDRVIHECIKLSPYRERIKLKSLHAATIHDVRRALLECNYRVVHFSGHGTDNGLVFENELGKPHIVPPDALAEFLSGYCPPVECVILNACYTQSQGRLIATKLPYTIAIENAISDSSAIEFARGFYDAIGAAKDIEFAYQEGCRAIKLVGYSDIPVLLPRTSLPKNS